MSGKEIVFRVLAIFVGLTLSLTMLSMIFNPPEMEPEAIQKIIFGLIGVAGVFILWKMPSPLRKATIVKLQTNTQLDVNQQTKGEAPVQSNVNEQPAANLEWHYSKDGHRFGPVTEAQIIEHIRMMKITEQSSVWNKSLPDWQPILTSKFADLVRDPNVPPPLPGAAVNNTIIWVLAFAPLIGTFLEGIFSGLTGISQESLWFITLALNIVLVYADAVGLKAAGHDTSKMGAAWLVPVYLFKRAKILKHNYAYFIVWCVLFSLLLWGSLFSLLFMSLASQY